jgi:hypothetical protein
MWHWDQGRLAYFDFDALRTISRYVQAHDFKQATRTGLQAATGLPFAAPATHSPWRNYSRVLKLCLLVSEVQGVAQPTPVAALLAQTGTVTSDEYFHFLAQASTEPNPALEAWTPTAEFRYPLLFTLKYILSKAAVGTTPSATLDEIIGAYRVSGFAGHEDDTAFIGILGNDQAYHQSGESAPDALRRQARESIKVLCQISYLHLKNNRVFINLDKKDALKAFGELNPIGGPRAADRDAEIRRLAGLFAGGSTLDFFDYPNTVVTEVVESGFQEGTKVQKTHVTIERNSGLRKAFFQANPTTVCDVCDLDTQQTYPWTERVMDLHHLLPLSSGTRVVGNATTFEDLVPLCPSCHRGVHRYYDNWFRTQQRRDFQSRDEAVAIYNQVKANFPGHINA